MATIYVITILLNLIYLSYQQQCVISTYEDVDSVVSSCTDIAIDDLIVPASTTLTLNLQEGTTLTLRGNISFGFDNWSGPLVLITGSSLTVIAAPGAVFDGQGERYWDGQGIWGSLKPLLLRIEATNSVFSGINILNCPIRCSRIKDSNNVTISNWNIDNSAGDVDAAQPQNSAQNTEGIQVVTSVGISLLDSQVTNQDDCVAINSGSNVVVSDINCDGSHGLSIGSIGPSGLDADAFDENSIDNVTIKNSALVNGQNGIQIITYVDAPNGLISNVLYENITFEGPNTYGIEIQQNYRNVPPNVTTDPTPVGNVPIVNLTLRNIVGNVAASAVPVCIKCADGACLNFDWHNVTVTGVLPNDCNVNPDGYDC
ncbi:polygalacturonase-like [Cylas formicarius]|uniref:polygalacturonase-like n=1 Tax=Cylas formicarius TaxID=197179 RepID=UPI002958C1CA|nr:polygalacturonase-like [Cylas formicarius]